MALSRGLNLGAPNATLINRPNTYNLAQALQGSAPPMQQAADGEDPAMRARRQALIDSLDSGMTAPLNGGGFGEALTRFGESYLRTKNGRSEREHEYRQEALANDRENRQAKLEERSALAQVLGQEQENKLGPEQWQDIPPDQLPQGARFGQRNSRTNEADVDWAPPPQRVAEAAPPVSYQVLTPEEARAEGLPPGSYQRNLSNNQIVPIGRTRGQYSEYAGSSAGFADRMNSADQTLQQLEDARTTPEGVYAAQTGFGGQQERQVRQAQREFVNAILRRESGAAIGADEFNSAAQQYFPQPGDGPEVLAQKRAARRRAIQGLMNASQGAYEEWYGEGSGAAETPQPRNRPRSNSPDGARPNAHTQRRFIWNPTTGRLE